MFFVCYKCGCVDAVDVAFRGQAATFPATQEQQLCTQCQTGSWHGLFLKLPYDPERDNVVNRATGISVC